MDDFLFLYLLMIAVAGVLFVAFWGVVIYVIIRVFRSSDLSTQEKIGIASGVLGAMSERGRPGPYEPGPNESAVRGMAASEGINLDR